MANEPFHQVIMGWLTRGVLPGEVEIFIPVPMLLVMGHFPEGTAGQTYWYHHDGRGSVAGLTKHLGQSTHNYRYDAYGQVLPGRGNFTDPHNHYTFLGKEWDENLGLYEFGVRLYDPWVGVWLTPEPLPGDAWRPRTWHRYTYAFANPISYYDPYGLAVTPEDGGAPLPPTPTPPTPSPTPTPTGAQCTPSAPGYSPRAANRQALRILFSWFFEIGPEVQKKLDGAGP